MSKAKNKTNSAFDLKQQMEQLDQILAWFESDQFTVEQAFEKYQAAEQLAKAIADYLQHARNELIKL